MKPGSFTEMAVVMSIVFVVVYNLVKACMHTAGSLKEKAEELTKDWE